MQIFLDGLRKNQLPKASVRSFLVCRAILYAAVERKFSQSADPRMRRIWGPECFKLPWLLIQMQASRVEKFPVVVSAIRLALHLASEIVSEMITDESQAPVSLLGYLYALETFQPHARSSMRDFIYRLSLIDLEVNEYSVFLSTDERAFSGLGKVAAALVSFADDDLKYHIGSVNPEAGSHAMPQDPLEIEVALRAAALSYDRFPELKGRFGERGYRFAKSNCCWLVTLIPGELKWIQKSISWLQGVLENRGIPSVILEGYLENIIQVFKEVIPERKEILENFSRIASSMQAERLQTRILRVAG